MGDVEIGKWEARMFGCVAIFLALAGLGIVLLGAYVVTHP